MAEQRAITEQQQQQADQEAPAKLCAKMCGFYGALIPRMAPGRA
jgi:hypothetical protein